RTVTQDFFVYGLVSSGSVSYTASASGLGSSDNTVTLQPSGFVLSGPLGIGADFLTTTGAANADLTIMSALLDPAGNFQAEQAVRGGLTVNVNVSSSNPSIGTITASPVTFSGGVGAAVTQFDPATPGTTLLSLATPAGFSTPAQGSSLSALVITPQ